MINQEKILILIQLYLILKNIKYEKIFSSKISELEY